MKSSSEFKQPEAALLVACARLKMQPENFSAAAAAIDRRPDWPVFVRAAREHGIVALVHRHFQDFPSSMVPAEVQEALREETLAQTRRNFRLAKELLAVRDLFAKHEISLISLKGPILAEQIYGSIALRKMSDLDFLITESDTLRAVEVLKERGYVSIHPDKRDADEVRPYTTHELQPLVSQTTGCVIDLHHALVPPVGGARFGFAEVLPRARSASFMGRTFQTLAPDELFVYLCEHGNHHLWSRLEWICSIAELLRSGIKDWNRAIEFADRLRGRKRLETAVRLAHELLDSPPPPDALSTQRAAASSAWVIHRYATNLEGVSKPAAIELFRFHLTTDQSLFARCDRVWKMVVLPRNSDIETFPLPRPLWPFYYLARPFLIVWRILGWGRRTR